MIRRPISSLKPCRCFRHVWLVASDEKQQHDKIIRGARGVTAIRKCKQRYSKKTPRTAVMSQELVSFCGGRRTMQQLSPSPKLKYETP